LIVLLSIKLDVEIQLRRLFYKFLFLSLCLFPKYQVFACTEQGQNDFKVPKKIEELCKKNAIKYAVFLAEKIQKLENHPANDFGLIGKLTKTDSVIYATEQNGNEKFIGINVTLGYKNKIECTYCLEFTFVDDKKCALRSIKEMMCVN
jgi:hypothetical protein